MSYNLNKIIKIVAKSPGNNSELINSNSKLRFCHTMHDSMYYAML